MVKFSANPHNNFPDKIISTFVLRPKLATEDHLDSSSSKRSQAIVSAIIVLKEAIYALPDFDKV